MNEVKYVVTLVTFTLIALMLGYIGYQFLMKNNFDYRASEAISNVLSVTAQYVDDERDRKRIARKLDEIRIILEKYRKCSHSH
jgi:hypothetical protein